MRLCPFLRGACAVAAAGAAFAFSAAAHADSARVTLVVGGKPVPFIVNPYIASDGEVFAPVDAVRLLGADFTPNAADQTVTVTGETGDAGEAGRTVTVPYENVQGRYCVPIQKVADALGASTDWQPVSDTLTIRARLLMVRDDANSLSIFTSYPVYYRTQRIPSQNKIYVDLYGLDLSAQPANIPVMGGNILHIRSGQMGENIVRVVVDLKRNVPFKVLSPLATDQVRVAMGRGALRYDQTAAVPVLEPAPSVPVMPLPPPSIVGSATRPGPASARVQITNLAMKTDGPLTQILITTTGPARYSTELLDNPYRLAFDLAGATLDTDQRQIDGAGSAIMKEVRAGVFRTGVREFGRVVVDLQKLVPFNVTHQEAPDGGTIYAINFQSPAPAAPLPTLPFNGGNDLAGKTIVIDPGHGYQDSGAVGIGGVMEKNLTLAIGLKLRATLVQDGATVFMTRDSDTFLPVMARPEFAVAHNADLFVSVHCDKSGPTNSHSGTTVYYHADNPICRRMAADISADIAQVCSLPSDGTKSDTIRFASGFGVLRGSPMPAVLVECGYVNDAADLTVLTNPDAQQQIANGIAAGMRDFLAGRTASR